MSNITNPHGVQGFEFVEFAAPDSPALHALFRQMGFVKVAHNDDSTLSLYQQGDIRLVINETTDSFAAEFARQHGPCCCGFALRVSDPNTCHQTLIEQGAKDLSDVGLNLNLPVIEGIGGSALYLTQSNSDIDELFAHRLTDEIRRIALCRVLRPRPRHQRHGDLGEVVVAEEIQVGMA